MNQRNTKASVALAFFIVLLASFAAMSALTAGNLLQACGQEAVLALVALAAVKLVVPDALNRCTITVQQRGIVRFATIALLLVGLVGGAITILTWLFAGSSSIAGFEFAALSSTVDLMKNLLLLLGICLLTGVYEESFMRVLGIETFERALGEGGGASMCPVSELAADGRVATPGDAERGVFRQPVVFDAVAKRAVVASALLFALLHVGVPDLSTGQLMLMQTALKFVQALLFGVILGVLYAQTRRLWPCVLIHAGFDVMYLGPYVLLTGAMPETYASGAASDTVLLAVTTLMLVGVALKIRKEIAC